MLAVAFLILVSLVAFLGVIVIGSVVVPSALTYVLIQLIFALLCGGAGALVGGSASVRQTLNLPGSPVQARLGGAISMVIVGFALAYVAMPPLNTLNPIFEMKIHGVPGRVQIGGAEYQIAPDNTGATNLALVREQDRISVKLPAEVGSYYGRLDLGRISGNTVQTVARCSISFQTHTRSASFTPNELVPEEREPFYHVTFSSTYVEKILRKISAQNQVIETEPCLEGNLSNKPEAQSPLSGRFSIHPNSVGSRMNKAWKFEFGPHYKLVAFDVSNNDPQDTLPDLPPRTSAPPGESALVKPGPAAAAPVVPGPTVAGNTSTVPAAPNSAGGAEPRLAPSNAVAPSPPADAAPPSGPLKPSALSPGPVAQSPSPAPAAQPQPGPGPGERLSDARLRELVDAYVRGQDQDRTHLYESWDRVAGYMNLGTGSPATWSRACATGPFWRGTMQAIT